MPAARSAFRCWETFAVDWSLACASASTVRGAWASRSSSSSRTGLPNALPIRAIASNSACFCGRAILRYSSDLLRTCQRDAWENGRMTDVASIVLQRRVPGPRADALLDSLQDNLPEPERARWDESGHARLHAPSLSDDPRESLAASLDRLADDWAQHIAIL